MVLQIGKDFSYHINLKILLMERMEDQNCSQQFQEIFGSDENAEGSKFNTIISELQQIVIDPYFQKMIDVFMKNNWAAFDENANKEQQLQVFQNYKNEVELYIQAAITKKIPDFNWVTFRQLFSSRRNFVDQQILDTLLSLEEIENFRNFLKDFRFSYEQVEMFKVLTIKSNKISENKKVKGKDNIFSGGDNAGFFDKGLKLPVQKKKSTVEKSQEELLVPDLILTVKPLRKA